MVSQVEASTLNIANQTIHSSQAMISSPQPQFLSSPSTQPTQTTLFFNPSSFHLCKCNAHHHPWSSQPPPYSNYHSSPHPTSIHRPQLHFLLPIRVCPSCIHLLHNLVSNPFKIHHLITSNHLHQRSCLHVQSMSIHQMPTAACMNWILIPIWRSLMN